MKEFKPKLKPIINVIIGIIILVAGFVQNISSILTFISVFIGLFYVFMALITFKFKVVIGNEYFAVNYKTTDKEKKDFNIYTENGQVFYKFSYVELKEININIHKKPYNIEVITVNDIKFNFSIHFFDKKIRLKIIDEFKEQQNKLNIINKTTARFD